MVQRRCPPGPARRCSIGVATSECPWTGMPEDVSVPCGVLAVFASSTSGLPWISHQLVHVGDSSVPTGITSEGTITLITLIPSLAVLLAVAVVYHCTGEHI